MRSVFFILFAAAVAACNSPTDGSTLATANYKINFDSGTVDTTTSTVDAVVPVFFHLTVDGTRISGAPIVWTIASGSGRVASASTVTDSLGNGSALWVLGDTAQVNKLSVIVAADSIQLVAVAKAGPASGLLRVSTDSMNASAGSTVALSVRVVDAVGNAVSGATVRWSSSGGDLSPAASTSDASGNAPTALLTGTTPGTYLVTATLPDRAAVTFQVVTN